jgi:hypothetical protein
MPDIIIHSVIGSPYGHVPLILDHDGFVLYETRQSFAMWIGRFPTVRYRLCRRARSREWISSSTSATGT